MILASVLISYTGVFNGFMVEVVRCDCLAADDVAAMTFIPKNLTDYAGSPSHLVVVILPAESNEGIGNLLTVIAV